jgi:hypothetical protein
MLASFLGVLPILTPPLCALAFIMCAADILTYKLEREANPSLTHTHDERVFDLSFETVLRHIPGCLELSM